MTTNEHSEYYYHHHIPDMEFSGLFDIIHGRIIFIKYFLFIKFDNKIYIDVESIGSIIIPFEDFCKNKKNSVMFETVKEIRDQTKVLNLMSV